MQENASSWGTWIGSVVSSVSDVAAVEFNNIKAFVSDLQDETSCDKLDNGFLDDQGLIMPPFGQFSMCVVSLQDDPDASPGQQFAKLCDSCEKTHGSQENWASFFYRNPELIPVSLYDVLYIRKKEYLDQVNESQRILTQNDEEHRAVAKEPPAHSSDSDAGDEVGDDEGGDDDEIYAWN